ncbi:putative biopolymer transport protein, ExbD-like [Aromatoleum petrolei]|nr:putative biopolymer transport protein, ExbD-like [Aromatoleum petrolei]
MQRMNFQRGRKHEAPDINLIPLIDVLLVLIIFLVLTTTYSKVSGLEINLPTADTKAAEVTPSEIVVAVNAAGDVLVNRQPVGDKSINAIAAALGRAVPAGGKDPVVVITADAKAAHQSVIDVMQAAQRAGLPHITFATQSAP